MFAYIRALPYLCIVVGSVNETNSRMDNKYKDVFLKKKER